jgi:hypothetical protein
VVLLDLPTPTVFGTENSSKLLYVRTKGTETEEREETLSGV